MMWPFKKKYPEVEYDDIADILYINFSKHGNTLGYDLDEDQNIVIFKEENTDFAVGVMITNGELIRRIFAALR